MSRANKRERFAELRALRQAGKKKFDTYEVAEAPDLFEEVDENEYKKIVRDRLNEDDFVVDDNGEGYADDGREEWDREPMYESESDDDLAVRGKNRKCRKPPDSRDLQRVPADPAPVPVQPRSSVRMSRRDETPMTGTSPSISQKALPRHSRSPR